MRRCTRVAAAGREVLVEPGRDLGDNLTMVGAIHADKWLMLAAHLESMIARASFTVSAAIWSAACVAAMWS
jgi:hypothetical protein